MAERYDRATWTPREIGNRRASRASVVDAVFAMTDTPWVTIFHSGPLEVAVRLPDPPDTLAASLGELFGPLGYVVTVEDASPADGSAEANQ